MTAFKTAAIEVNNLSLTAPFHAQDAAPIQTCMVNIR